MTPKSYNIKKNSKKYPQTSFFETLVAATNLQKISPKLLLPYIRISSPLYPQVHNKNNSLVIFWGWIAFLLPPSLLQLT